jgi:hypothetical protein
MDLFMMDYYNFRVVQNKAFVLAGAQNLAFSAVSALLAAATLL